MPQLQPYAPALCPQLQPYATTLCPSYKPMPPPYAPATNLCPHTMPQLQTYAPTLCPSYTMPTPGMPMHPAALPCPGLPCLADNLQLVRCVLVAGLYPNVVQVDQAKQGKAPKLNTQICMQCPGGKVKFEDQVGGGGTLCVTNRAEGLCVMSLLIWSRQYLEFCTFLPHCEPCWGLGRRDCSLELQYTRPPSLKHFTCCTAPTLALTLSLLHPTPPHTTPL